MKLLLTSFTNKGLNILPLINPESLPIYLNEARNIVSLPEQYRDWNTQCGSYLLQGFNGWVSCQCTGQIRGSDPHLLGELLLLHFSDFEQVFDIASQIIISHIIDFSVNIKINFR